MKKLKPVWILLFALCFMLSSSANAQSWNLLQEGKLWNHMLKSYSFEINKYIINTSAHKFMNDTLINDTLYKKVYYSWGTDEGFVNWSPNEGYVREDEGGFYFRSENSSDKQIYNYNLQGHDIFSAKYPFSDNGDSIPVYVKDIDSVLINGVYKKRYWMQGMWKDDGREDWIEGIGSLSGIITPFFNEMATGGEVRLLCYFENGELLYKNPLLGLSECHYKDYVLSSDEIVSKSIGVYPNPVNDFLNLESDLASDLNYSICDLSGRVYLSGQLENNRINVSSLSKGVYVLRLSYMSGTIVHKLIKE